LEEMNRWGGSVLGHVGYGFEHDTSKVDFIPTIEVLLDSFQIFSKACEG